MIIKVRKETRDDYPDVKRVVKAAFEKEFGKDKESTLIERLRQNAVFIPDLSLVAVVGDSVVGHALFFPVVIRSDCERPDALSLSLAPIAVAPDFQRKGIGKRLIEEGLSIAATLGHKSVIVFGHPSYYPRFGFKPAGNWHVKPSFSGVPDNAFMAIELLAGGLTDSSGTVQLPEEFNEAIEAM
ncbi:MAG: N-acetyltransferase [Nitrospirae bacterium]|nr:N-acetyltransferase [Nitrospirota bacterium]